LLHQFGILRGPDEADQHAALAHQRHFLGTRRPHLEHEVGPAPQGGSVGDHLGSGCAIGLVTDAGGISGARLHLNGETQLDELFNDFGHRGNAFLAGHCFLRHAYDL